MHFTAAVFAVVVLLILMFRRDDARGAIFVAALCGSMIPIFDRIADPVFSAISSGLSAVFNSFAG